MQKCFFFTERNDHIISALGGEEDCGSEGEGEAVGIDQDVNTFLDQV